MDKKSFEKTLIILGTARGDSYTLNALMDLAFFNPSEFSPSEFSPSEFSPSEFNPSEIIELHKLTISPYNYNQPAHDDFLLIAEKMTRADVIVFATPVYWYSMSGFLKVFFDRLTDLISTSKNGGRGLAGKKVYLFATGSDDQLPDGFEVPFVKTSEYFDMKYQRAFYICTADKN